MPDTSCYFKEKENSGFFVHLLPKVTDLCRIGSVQTIWTYLCDVAFSTLRFRTSFGESLDGLR